MITTDTNKVIYVSDGTTTEYDFSFTVYDKSHLKVYIQSPDSNKPTILEEANYSVVLNEDYFGGKIILNQPLSQNTKISIIREVDKTQEIHYIEGSPFPAQSHERALDKLTMITQQLDEKISRIPQGSIFNSNIDFDDLYNSIQYCSDNIEALAKSISITVNTIKDLIALDTANLIDKTAVLVLGYHEPNDGGGGIFYWDTQQSKSNHDGGIIIDPTVIFPTNWNNITQQDTWFNSTNVGNGCWIRQYNYVVNVKWFGAKGDADYNTLLGSDDTNPIQTAINHYNNIFIPKGLYYITNTIEINNKHDFIIYGEGKFSSMLVTKNHKISMLIIKNSHQILIEKIGVNGGSYDVTSELEQDISAYSGIGFENSYDCIVNSCASINILYAEDVSNKANFPIGACFGGSSIDDTKPIKFIDCYAKGAKNYGFALNGGNCVVDRCISKLNGTRGLGSRYTKNLIVTNSIFGPQLDSNVITTNDLVIAQEDETNPNYNKISNNVRIENCYFYSNNQNLFLTACDNLVVENCIINNDVRVVNSGTDLTGAGKKADFTFNNCQIKGNFYYGSIEYLTIDNCVLEKGITVEYSEKTILKFNNSIFKGDLILKGVINSYITNNEIYGKIVSANEYAYNTKIVNNTFILDSYDALSYAITGKLTSFKISNNSFTNYGCAILLNYSDKVVITNNSFYNCGTSNSSNPAIIFASYSNDIIINNNYFENVSNYPLYFKNTCNNVVIIGNSFIGGKQSIKVFITTNYIFNSNIILPSELSILSLSQTNSEIKSSSMLGNVFNDNVSFEYTPSGEIRYDSTNDIMQFLSNTTWKNI